LGGGGEPVLGLVEPSGLSGTRRLPLLLCEVAVLRYVARAVAREMLMFRFDHDVNRKGLGVWRSSRQANHGSVKLLLLNASRHR